MMYTHEKVYRSITYFLMQIVPSGVVVTDGESYGVRLDDPRGQSPSVAVVIDQSGSTAIELGSNSIQFNATITISALSRFQRDALKSIIMSGLFNTEIPVYSAFDEFIPSGVIERYLDLGDYFKIRDMPNFATNREKFFWVSVVFVDLDLLGT